MFANMVSKHVRMQYGLCDRRQAGPYCGDGELNGLTKNAMNCRPTDYVLMAYSDARSVPVLRTPQGQRQYCGDDIHQPQEEDCEDDDDDNTDECTNVQIPPCAAMVYGALTCHLATNAGHATMRMMLIAMAAKMTVPLPSAAMVYGVNLTEGEPVMRMRW